MANYHLELTQLCRCPVSWCTQWKGTPQDSVDHIQLSHVVPPTVKSANLGKWFPPWTVSRETWCDALNSHVSGVSTDVLLFSKNSAPLIHHYRVFGQSGAHASLRGRFIIETPGFYSSGGGRGQMGMQPYPGAVGFIAGGLRSSARRFANGNRMTTPHVARLVG